MKFYTLSFPTFGLTRSVRDLLDPRNCVDPHSWVVSYLLTFLRSSSLMYKEREERFSQRHPLHCNPDASRYAMSPFRCMVTVGHNPRVFVKYRRPTEREETAKLRYEGDMWPDAWSWCCARSHSPPGCLRRLWRSVSTLPEPFRPDGNVFCWCWNRLIEFPISGRKEGNDLCIFFFCFSLHYSYAFFLTSFDFSIVQTAFALVLSTPGIQWSGGGVWLCTERTVRLPWVVLISCRTYWFVQLCVWHDNWMLFFLSLSLVWFIQSRRSIPKEGDNISAAHALQPGNGHSM